jgi:hypothetical protein
MLIRNRLAMYNPESMSWVQGFYFEWTFRDLPDPFMLPHLEP